MAYTNIAVSFNDTLLTSVNGLSVLSTDAYNLPKRNLKTESITGFNRNITTSGNYEPKYINVGFNITAISRDVAERKLSDLLLILQPLEKNLVIRLAGNNRTWTASLKDLSLSKSGGAYIEGVIVFVSKDIYNYDVSPTLITNQTGITSTYKGVTYTQGGNVPEQYPIITLQYTAIGNPTDLNTVYVANTTTNQTLVVYRLWTAGDILIINGYNKTVKVNGSYVDYEGGLLVFGLGVQYFTIRDTFTTRTYNINAVVYNGYL